MRLTWLVTLALAGTSACGRSDTAQRARLLDTPAVRRLVGTWEVSLFADFRDTLRMRAPDSVTGMLAFTADHFGPPDAAELQGITHEGTYDLDFQPFGWSMRGADGPPVAVARVVSAAGSSVSDRAPDSIYVVLSPGTARFAVRMSGALVGDSAAGVWSARSFSAGGGAGRFVMRRRAATP